MILRSALRRTHICLSGNPPQGNVPYAAPRISQVGKQMELFGFDDDDADIAIKRVSCRGTTALPWECIAKEGVLRRSSGCRASSSRRNCCLAYKERWLTQRSAERMLAWFFAFTTHFALQHCAGARGAAARRGGGGGSRGRGGRGGRRAPRAAAEAGCAGAGALGLRVGAEVRVMCVAVPVCAVWCAQWCVQRGGRSMGVGSSSGAGVAPAVGACLLQASAPLLCLRLACRATHASNVARPLPPECSLRSNLDNHPGSISEPRYAPRRPRAASAAGGDAGAGAGLIRLDPRTGIPLGVLPRRGAGAAPEQQGAAAADSGSDQDEGEAAAARASGVPERRKGESAEEKKARKAAVKEAKRGAREQKKELKSLYKEATVAAQRRVATAQPQARLKLPS